MAFDPKCHGALGTGLIIVTITGFCGDVGILEQIFIYLYLVILLVWLVSLVCSYFNEREPESIWTSLVALGFMAALIYILVRTYTKGDKVEANLRVSDATLTQFQFELTNHTLYYNLNVTFVGPNHPNRKIGGVEASAFYLGHRFSQVLFAATNTASATNVSGIPVAFRGQQVVVFTSEELSRFSQEWADGIYGIDVKLVYSIVGIGHLHRKVDGGSDGNYKLSKVDKELIMGEVEFALKVSLSELPITRLVAGGRLASDATSKGDMIYSS